MGQKHSGEPSIVSAFLPAHPSLLWILIVLTILDLARQFHHKTLQRLGQPRGVIIAVSILTATAILWFKIVFTLNDAPELFGPVLRPIAHNLASMYGILTVLARLAFLLPTATLLYTFFHRLRHPHIRLLPSLAPPFQAILLLQTRLTNIPLLGLFSPLTHFLTAPSSSTTQTPTSIALTTTLLSHASFFALGNTNSISSIDLSNAYNGVASFDILAVGILLLLSTFAGPFYWSLWGLEALSSLPSKPQSNSRGQLKEQYTDIFALKTLFMASSAVSVMAACMALREHLFVWTVFSPKFLFYAAWFLGWHGVWGGVVEGVLVWAGGV